MPDPSDRSTFPAPRWSLPDNPDLGWLKKRAKRLRRYVAAGDPEAVDLVSASDPAGWADHGGHPELAALLHAAAEVEPPPVDPRPPTQRP